VSIAVESAIEALKPIETKFGKGFEVGSKDIAEEPEMVG
jgi:hypothetical protein